MLISKYIEIVLTNRTFKKTVKRYNLINVNIGDSVKIPIDEIPTSSHSIVEVTCDYCNKLLSIPYKRYNLNIKVVNKISCSNIDCSNQKIKDVCQKKWGVDNPFQANEIKDKIKETLNEKYGVDHPMFLEETKNKIKKTCIERYGETNYTKTDEFKKKTIKTNLERYGVEWTLQNKEIREKGKITNLEKYGVDHSQKCKIIRDKTIETNIKNWGVDCNLKCEETKNKIKETNIEKYGYGNPMKNDGVKNKVKETILNNWGTSNMSMSDKFRLENYNISKNEFYINYLGSSVSLFKCDMGCDHNFEINTSNYYNRIINSKLCTICNPIGDSKSINEKVIFNYIKSIYNGEIIHSYRDKIEIDIYLPELKLGFEYNGLYWHSDKYKDKDYHKDKTNYFKDKGIRIIHIWEDDWRDKREIIESQIKNRIGLSEHKIYARKCEVREVSIKESRIFLDKCHIQGFVKSNIKLGLYHNSELISIMTFDKFEGRKKMEDNSWNLSRFCNNLNTNVVGGASKLFYYFIKNYNPNRIVSYADADWSTGELYQVLNFDLISENKPDYKYIVKDKRIHKSRYRKSNLNTNLSECEYTKLNNIPKVWDCGKIKYEKKIPK
jgi:hypothetical protein